MNARTAGAESWTNSINAAGISVGFTTSDSGQVVACSWDTGGNITLLPSLGGTYGVAYDVNDSGQIVGFSVTNNQREAGAIWGPDGTVRSLGALPGYSQGMPCAINSSGQVVGYSSFGPAGDGPITLWNPDGGIIRLSSSGEGFDGCADINDLGQIVARWNDGSRTHPLFYSRETGAIELSVAGVKGLLPFQINNSGAISCFGYDLQSGKSRFIVLDPIPEPSTAIGLVFGLTAVLGRRRARRLER